MNKSGIKIRKIDMRNDKLKMTQPQETVNEDFTLFLFASENLLNVILTQVWIIDLKPF